MRLFDKISKDVILALEKLHINLSHLYCLENIENGIDVSEFPESITFCLERKNFIISPHFSLTNEGKLLLDILSDPNFSFVTQKLRKELKKVRSDQSTQWKEFIEIYPATGSWITPLGTSLTSSRRLRQDTIENEKKYLSILASGVAHSDMKMVLMYQIELIKKESIRLKTNKMEFMQGTTPYLNQNTWKTFMNEMKRKNWQPDPIFWTDKGEEKIIVENTTIDTTNMYG